MTLNPSRFEEFAVPIGSTFTRPNSVRRTSTGEQVTFPEYLEHLKKVGGFDDVPFLEINKQLQGTMATPFVSGHEGRHRNRAMAQSGEKSGLVQLLPRSELREPFPRRSQEEYIEALKKELEMTGNVVLPQTNTSQPNLPQRPAIELPDIYAEGGEVRMSGGGRTGILGALARTAERGVERAAKAAKPIESVVQVSTIKMPKAAQEVVSDAERAANLAKFLEKSKVQQRLYHGTRTSFNEFKHGEGKDTDFGRFGRGFYFTPDADLASAYTRNETGGNIMPVFLSIKNPYMFKGSESQELLRKFGGGPEPTHMFSEEGKKWAESVREGLEKMGYDGYMDATDPKYAKEIVAFQPNQIKSAIGNRGTYDIDDPDITKANGGDITIDEFLNRMKAR